MIFALAKEYYSHVCTLCGGSDHLRARCPLEYCYHCNGLGHKENVSIMNIM